MSGLSRFISPCFLNDLEWRSQFLPWRTCIILPTEGGRWWMVCLKYHEYCGHFKNVISQESWTVQGHLWGVCGGGLRPVTAWHIELNPSRSSSLGGTLIGRQPKWGCKTGPVNRQRHFCERVQLCTAGKWRRSHRSKRSTESLNYFISRRSRGWKSIWWCRRVDNFLHKVLNTFYTSIFVQNNDSFLTNKNIFTFLLVSLFLRNLLHLPQLSYRRRKFYISRVSDLQVLFSGRKTRAEGRKPRGPSLWLAAIRCLVSR